MSSLPKPWWAWALAAVILGTAYSVWLLGWRSLDVTNLAWLHGDPQQSYLGWAFMRFEPGWPWPPTWIGKLNYPFGLSAAFTDAIPLMALLFKPFAAVLPDPFQYSGIWMALCGILQIWAGFLLAGRIGAKTATQVLLVGLLFLAAPILTQRFGGHFALSAQWLVLFSFYLYIAPFVRLRHWLALIFLAGLINPYLAAMVMMVFAAFLLRRRALEGLGWRPLAGACGAGFAVLVGSWILAGFVVLGKASSFAGIGLGYFSANLLSLIDAGAEGALIGVTLGSGAGQYEGNGYLGAGAIALLALAVLQLRRQWPTIKWQTLKPLLFILFFSLIIALSHQVRLGEWNIVDYGGSLPGFLLDAWSAFRASGRFIWLLHYAILIAALMLVFRASNPRFVALLLAAAVALQVYDLTPRREAVRAVANLQPEQVLRDGIWEVLSQKHRHLIALPAWQCGPTKSPFSEPGFWTLGQLALQQGLTLNSYYAARITAEELRYNCGDLIGRVLEGERLPDSAYVFSIPLARELIARGQMSGCRLVDGVVLCTNTLPEVPPAAGWQSLIADYTLGTRLDLSDVPKSSAFLGVGWLEKADGATGLSTIGFSASVVFRLAEPATGDRRLRIELGQAGGRPDRPFPLTLRVNGVDLAAYVLPTGQDLPTLSLVVPAALVGADRVIEIEFATKLTPATENGSIWPLHRLEVRAIELR